MGGGGTCPLIKILLSINVLLCASSLRRRNGGSNTGNGGQPGIFIFISFRILLKIKTVQKIIDNLTISDF